MEWPAQAPREVGCRQKHLDGAPWRCLLRGLCHGSFAINWQRLVPGGAGRQCQPRPRHRAARPSRAPARSPEPTAEPPALTRSGDGSPGSRDRLCGVARRSDGVPGPRAPLVRRLIPGRAVRRPSGRTSRPTGWVPLAAGRAGPLARPGPHVSDHQGREVAAAKRPTDRYGCCCGRDWSSCDRGVRQASGDLRHQHRDRDQEVGSDIIHLPSPSSNNRFSRVTSI